VAVDTWHANAHGLYSDETSQQAGGATSGGDTSGQNFLRGYQITGKDAGIHPLRGRRAGQLSNDLAGPGGSGGYCIPLLRGARAGEVPRDRRRRPPTPRRIQ
jgi:hypothetical protein